MKTDLPSVGAGFGYNWHLHWSWTTLLSVWWDILFVLYRNFQERKKYECTVVLNSHHKSSHSSLIKSKAIIFKFPDELYLVGFTLTVLFFFLRGIYFDSWIWVGILWRLDVIHVTTSMLEILAVYPALGWIFACLADIFVPSLTVPVSDRVRQCMCHSCIIPTCPLLWLQLSCFAVSVSVWDCPYNWWMSALQSCEWHILFLSSNIATFFHKRTKLKIQSLQNFHRLFKKFNKTQMFLNFHTIINYF